jgi:hypothetical protein
MLELYGNCKQLIGVNLGILLYTEREWFGMEKGTPVITKELPTFNRSHVQKHCSPHKWDNQVLQYSTYKRINTK